MGAVVDHAWGNAVLECLLARAGWAPENLGDRLNELAARLGRRDRIHRKSIRRRVYTEPGRSVPAVPREPWPGLVCHLLRERLGEPVTLDSLGWNAAGPLRIAAADDGLNQSWNPRGAVAVLASVVDADAMERRHFMALTGLPLTPGRAPMAARPGSGGGLSAGQASRSRAGGRLWSGSPTRGAGWTTLSGMGVILLPEWVRAGPEPGSRCRSRQRLAGRSRARLKITERLCRGSLVWDDGSVSETLDQFS